MSDPDDPTSWKAKSDADLLCIDNNLNNTNVPWDVICFHAQQAAEKMLKALLVKQRQAVPYTHDLVGLLDECAQCGTSLPHLRVDCALLTQYAVAFRYPGLAPDPDEAEGRAAIEAARRIYDAARLLL